MMNIDILVTKEAELDWLRYILDSFAIVSGTSFRFNICSQTQYVRRDNNIVITYGIEDNLKGNKVISVPRVTHYQPGDYRYIVSEGLHDNRLKGIHIPVLQKTFGPEQGYQGRVLLREVENGSCCTALVDKSIKLSFDLFYNSFFHLSCLEEWEHEKRFASTYSYTNRLKEKRAIYQKPVVNYLFAVLEDVLQLLAEVPNGDSLSRKRKHFQICLTHDVDYIKKTALLILRRSAFYLSSTFRELSKAKLFSALKEMYRSLCFLLTPCDYWQFEYIQKLEQTYGLRSTFYIYAGAKEGQMSERFKRVVFDPGYDIVNDDRMQKKIKGLTKKGWEVGLHGSFGSHDSLKLMLKEKNRLEAITESPVLSIRQHWLRLSLSNTWKMQAETGIKVDTTLGFNDCIGFRAGVANPFYPYDFDKGERHQILEVPLVLMDSSVFDYCRMDDNEARQKSLEILEEVKKFNGCVAINWHQRTSAADYRWYWLYREILIWIKENGGEAVPISRCLKVVDR